MKDVFDDGLGDEFRGEIQELESFDDGMFKNCKPLSFESPVSSCHFPIVIR